MVKGEVCIGKKDDGIKYKINIYNVESLVNDLRTKLWMWAFQGLVDFCVILPKHQKFCM